MPWRHRRVEVLFYSFLNRALDGVGIWCHTTAVLPQEQSRGTCCTGWWIGLRASLDNVGKENLFASLKFEAQTIQTITSPYTKYNDRHHINILYWHPVYYLAGVWILSHHCQNTPTEEFLESVSWMLLIPHSAFLGNDVYLCPHMQTSIRYYCCNCSLCALLAAK
jgi:hypothetical protein